MYNSNEFVRRTFYSLEVVFLNTATEEILIILIFILNSAQEEPCVKEGLIFCCEGQDKMKNKLLVTKPTEGISRHENKIIINGRQGFY